MSFEGKTMTTTFDLTDYGDMRLAAQAAKDTGFTSVMIDPAHAIELIDEVGKLNGEKLVLVASLNAIRKAYDKLEEHLSLTSDPVREPQPDDPIQVPHKLLDELHWAYREAMRASFGWDDSPGRRGVPDEPEDESGADAES